MNRIREIFILLIAAIGAVVLLPAHALPGELYSAGDTLSRDYLINQIRIETSSRIKSGIKFPLKNFTGVKFNSKTKDAIHTAILEILQQGGYYLAEIDSEKVTASPQKNQLNYQIYLNPGPLFLFEGLDWQLVDTIASPLDEEINRRVGDFRGEPYTEKIQNNLFRRIVNLFENNGYPLCRIETTGFTLDSLENDVLGIIITAQINPGKMVHLARLRVPKESEINVGYLERVFHFRKGEVYREQNIERYQRLLRRQDFIRTVERPELLLTADSLYVLNLRFQKAPATSLDGIVGYVPPPVTETTENGYFTGMFNIGLRNLFGTGRRLDVYWQKPDRFSEEFRFRYREPFLLGLPFHAGGTLHRLIRDTTYIEWEYSLNTEIPLNEWLTGNARFYSREVYPDSLASRRLRLPQTRSVHTELGINWDTRDDLYNPRTGLLFDVSFDYGTQRNVGPFYLLKEDSIIDKTDVTRVTARLASFFPIFSNQVLAFDFHSVLIGYQGEEVRTPDMFWFGGATTLRGYREDQFFAEKVGWVNMEYRFILSPQSRLFIFSDLGYYSHRLPVEKKEFLAGYGLGIGFPGPLGILQVDYGLAKGLSFSEGKIHFRIINDF